MVILPFFSIHAVVWHFAADTGGEFAAAVIADIVGEFVTRINNTGGQ
jgi:hypothetical protein